MGSNIVHDLCFYTVCGASAAGRTILSQLASKLFAHISNQCTAEWTSANECGRRYSTLYASPSISTITNG